MVDAILKKMKLKLGMHGFVMARPDDLDALDRAVTESFPSKGTEDDFGILFVHSQEALNKNWTDFSRRIREDGLIWICYPKTSAGYETDINRDKGWGVVQEDGYRPVSQVAVNDVWSALRFRREKYVRAK